MRRKSRTFLVEIKVPSQESKIISDADIRLIKWDPRTNYLVCELGRMDSRRGKAVRKILFRKAGHEWFRVDTGEEAPQNRPEIILEENLNTPPRIVAVDSAEKKKVLLFDLNPQFANLSFGKVEEITWKDKAGDDRKGGLYWPPGYITGAKYPLVIQTHGWTLDKFWIDGPFTTAFAAQPLANRGFFVLQDSSPEGRFWDTSEEGPRAMAAYEGAIDYLDRRGLIDVNRVALIGFSRTCFHVTYTLTHSKYHFAAAAIVDGIDAGYFQYMAFANYSPPMSNEYDLLNGAPPVGDGLSLWMKRSPPFLMDRIRTPVRVQAIGPTSLLYEWNWYSGLSRLGKPVELIYIPDGTHILEKPWNRLVSQEGNVDWFRFWLKGEEDPDPAKADQYARWRELREMQCASVKPDASSR